MGNAPPPAAVRIRIPCPDGSEQVGDAGAYPNYGQIRFIPGGNIDFCLSQCRDNPLCGAFTYDEDSYSEGVSGALCGLYHDSALNGPSGDFGDQYGESHPKADQTLCALERNYCPSDSIQIGDSGAYVGYWPLSSTADDKRSLTAQACQNNCAAFALNLCQAFVYDSDAQGDGGYQAICYLYSTTQQSGDYGDQYGGESHPRADQVLCALESVGDCPSGSTQIGGPGATIYRTSYDTWWRLSSTTGDRNTLTDQVCQNNCAADGRCRSFVYDSDYQYVGGIQAICILYNTNQQIAGGADYGDEFGEYHPRADQILCGMGSSALSPGLFNFDVDGNGEPVQLSAYIIYGVIGLILVNIICMVIYCWNKCNKGSNRRRYKIVSMKSDIDTDVENQ